MRRGQCALWSVVILLAFLATLELNLLAQGRQPRSSQSPPSSHTPFPPSSPTVGFSIPRKLIKESYEKMRKDAEDLLALAAELKEETGKANEDILSVSVVKKAEEIEKLAKKIRNRMKTL